MSEPRPTTLSDHESYKKIALEIAKHFKTLLQSKEFTPQFDEKPIEITESKEYDVYNKDKCEQAESNPETKTTKTN